MINKPAVPQLDHEAAAFRDFFVHFTADVKPLGVEMSSQRIIGIVLLVVGVAALIIGMNASHSAVDQVNQTFTGRWTDKTTWYVLGGLAVGLVGLLMAVFGVTDRQA